MIIDTLTKSAILFQNKSLQDSIKILNEKLNKEPITGLDIVNNVNTFYNTAWSNLLWVVGALLAIVGVIIPLVIQYWQNKKVKTSENDLRKEIASAVSIAKNEITDAINQANIEISREIEIKIEQGILNLDAKFKQIRYSSYARSLQLQAGINNSANKFNDAFVDVVRSVEAYLIADELVQATKLFVIIDDLLENGKLTKESIKSAELIREFDLKATLISIKEKQVDFAKHIDEIITLLENLPVNN